MAAAITAGVSALVVGAFLNVLAFRVSGREASSRCRDCGTAITFCDMVPVFSRRLRRGRCRTCATRIPARYALVQGAAAVLAALVIVVRGPGSGALLSLVLLALLAPVTLIDLERRIIPNRITGPGAIVAVAVGLVLDPAGEPERLLAGVAAAGFLLLALLVCPGGMGMGDVKLAGMLGLFLGRDVGVAMLVALVLGTVVGVGIVARKGVAAGRRTRIPFGPFLALGGIVGMLGGDPIASWYLATAA